MVKKEAQKDWDEFTSSRVVEKSNIDNAKLVVRLQKPKGKVDVVIDTDTYNEIDDQFAVAYLVKSDEKLNLKAIYAAPFHNEKSTGPADGMEKKLSGNYEYPCIAGKRRFKTLCIQRLNSIHAF